MQPLDLSRDRQIVVLTGAGISVASGLPTYRGQGGLWTRAKVANYATVAAMAASPARVWEVFGEMRAQIGAAAPIPAHFALAGAEARLGAGQRFTVLTQM